MTTHEAPRYRVRIEFEQDVDLSWLDQPMYDPDSPEYDPIVQSAEDIAAGVAPIDPEWYRDPENHLVLCAIVERRCPCCGTWKPAGSLGNIDFLTTDHDANRDVDETVEEHELEQLHTPYLREIAADLIAEARASEQEHA